MAEKMTDEAVTADLMAHAGAALGAKGGGGAEAAAAAARAAADKAASDKAAAEKAAAEAGKGKEDEGGKGDEPGYKNPSDAKNFRALREIAESMKQTARAAEERADRLEKELRDLRNPPQKDPLDEAIEKMDPTERKRLEQTGVMPLILAGVKAQKEAREARAKADKAEADLGTRAQKEEAQSVLLGAIAEYGDEHKLPDEYLEGLFDVVAEGKVAGRTHRDLLDNAREVYDLRLAAKAAKEGKGGEGGSEADLARRAAKAAAGGADASAGAAAPAAGGSRKELLAKYDALKETDPAEADRVLLTAMTRPGDLRKMPAGLLPTTTK